MIVLIPTSFDSPLMSPQAVSPLLLIVIENKSLALSYTNAQPVLPNTYAPPFAVNSGFTVRVIDDDSQSTLTANIKKEIKKQTKKQIDKETNK